MPNGLTLRFIEAAVACFLIGEAILSQKKWAFVLESELNMPREN
jgi:hypothetical protein